MTAAFERLRARMATEEPSPRLSTVLAAIGDPGTRVVQGDADVEITEVTCDSRRVRPKALFFALPGHASDGMRYVGEALRAGASAIVLPASRATEGALVAAELRGGASLPVVAADEPRKLLGLAAAELAGRPSERMTVVGVTGTSGKTSTTYFCESIAREAGIGAGVLGTIEQRWAGQIVAADLTTPDAVELQKVFASMRQAGVSHVFMEVSSHALALDRLAGTALTAGVYTNLSRDHLDYHGDLAEYEAAKAKLFREVLPSSPRAAFAVLNATDPRIRGLARETTVPAVTFGAGGDTDVEDVALHAGGIRGTLRLGGERVPFETRLIGSPHLANLLAAATVCWRLGFSTEAIARGIGALGRVPGRLESMDLGQPFRVVVDYAHKPDALERTLESLRGLTTGRLIAVFGCGGDRDRGKRPVMGEIAGRLADLVIITSDNPRTEDPMAIIDAIVPGVQGANCTSVAQEALGQGGVAEYAVVPERRAAIDRAIAIAREGDVVVIAGKGHEDYQIVGTTKWHLDDREEVCRALSRRGFAADGTGTTP
jgi:UDP-N-acetylmuramoyl-L-alanyl-D-glutamate--2,6-diaminopimelate ligase